MQPRIPVWLAVAMGWRIFKLEAAQAGNWLDVFDPAWTPRAAGGRNRNRGDRSRKWKGWMQQKRERGAR